jgi:hypothetical protein
MGTLSGIGHPLFSYPLFHDGNGGSHALGGRGPASLLRRYGGVDRSTDRSPFGEGHGGVLAGRISFRDGGADAEAVAHTSSRALLIRLKLVLRLCDRNLRRA